MEIPTSIMILPMNFYQFPSVSFFSNFADKNVILPGKDCFHLNNSQLFVKANAIIDETVIRNRLISVMVKVRNGCSDQKFSNIACRPQKLVLPREAARLWSISRWRGMSIFPAFRTSTMQTYWLTEVD